MVGALQNPYQKYLKTKIETASQPQLLVMLFDAAVKKLHTAKRAIGEKKIEDSHNNLVKVQKIFSELMVALDFEMGGELAKQLFSIYEFVYRRLVDANIRQDSEIIDEVLPIVDQLREGWTAAVAKFEEDPEAAKAQANAQRAANAVHKKSGPPMKGNVTSLPVPQHGAPPRSAMGAPERAAAAMAEGQPIAEPKEPVAQPKPLPTTNGAAYGPGAVKKPVQAPPPQTMQPISGYAARNQYTDGPLKDEDKREEDRPRLNLRG